MLVSKLIQFILQSATFTHLMTPIPAIFHFHLLIFRPENKDIVLRLFKTSDADISFCKVGIISVCMYRSHYYKLLILGFLFILMYTISKTKMKRHADKGSPCLVPLSNSK